jgi:hypothetical protein
MHTRLSYGEKKCMLPCRALCEFGFYVQYSITLSKFKVYLCNFYFKKCINWGQIGEAAPIFLLQVSSPKLLQKFLLNLAIFTIWLYYNREDYIWIQYIGKLRRTLSLGADVELKDRHSKSHFSTINQKYRQNHICSITRAFVSVNLEIRLGKVQLYCNSFRHFEIVCAVNEYERQCFAETNKERIRQSRVL